jgi:hypothetical protein
MAEARRDTNPEGETKINQPKPKNNTVSIKGESFVFLWG